MGKASAQALLEGGQQGFKPRLLYQLPGAGYAFDARR